MRRPRLEAQLAGLIERHPALVVAATAGAGKTTAVAAAAATLDRELAWLTLDATDAAPGRLVGYLEAALAARLPHLEGVATDALAARIPHPEAAGVLAEAIGSERVLLVLDELERLDSSPEAWAVIEALLRYAGDGLRVVLISRRAVSLTLRRPLRLPMLPESALAFTRAEAAEALAATGADDIDPAMAVEATGGWVTGVLFEAWRVDEHVAGAGGEADPLHGYLSDHIIETLVPEDRAFLVATSVLDEVTAARARALGRRDAAARLASLRAQHLPAVWRDDGRVLRCHPRFREYLLELLERHGVEEVASRRLSYGHLLAEEGRVEEAIEQLLAAGAPEDALPLAERAIFPVIDRLDFAVAERWIRQIRDVIPSGISPLVIAELMLALGVEDFRRGAALADELAERGLRATVAPAAAVLMMLCYAHVGRLDAMAAVLAETEPGPEAEVLRYYMTIYGSDAPAPRPPLTGGPLDALVLAVDYGFGRFAELVAGRAGGWVSAWAQPWTIAALANIGHTEQALELYDTMRARGLTSASLDASVGPHVLVNVGRREDALAAIERGRRAARAGGSIVYEELASMSEARLALRLDRDPATARAVLDRLRRREPTSRLGYLAEQVDSWYGYALLLQNSTDAALLRLRRAVASMLRSERVHELPTAAVYLAEAEWRAGDEDAADRAADVALEASRLQGSNHMLLQALADFPAVVTRRLDAEPAADSPWHELGRSLIAQGIAIGASVATSTLLIEFGRCGLLVDGEEQRPRIAKSYELLAYLATRRPPWRAEREALLDALFEGRADDAARAYLRQAVRWLRHALGEERVTVQDGVVRVLGGDAIATESLRFEAALAEAARLRGDDRRTATLLALEVIARGEYLPGVRSEWAEERRRRLAELATDARYEAAELAFAAGRLAQARALVESVLRADRFRETAWRLSMRLLSGLGDEDGVIRAYQECERALAEIGAVPSTTTRQLLMSLRR
ncbi:BTAD domain-containing putative transcriptional regulator [Solirubrobacter soli]|uniref:BTAD domain-containing putative transcriptional regulator n=1 Tax=Solirubrobacter soli TaxID=363832 RepID=UPI00040D5BFB|nr:BTAD domain-containing putative transcriptional regulator [Solirubrobacter soli]